MKDKCYPYNWDLAYSDVTYLFNLSAQHVALCFIIYLRFYQCNKYDIWESGPIWKALVHGVTKQNKRW